MGRDERVDALERALVARRQARHALHEASQRAERHPPEEPLPPDVEAACRAALARLEEAEARLQALTMGQG